MTKLYFFSNSFNLSMQQATLKTFSKEYGNSLSMKGQCFQKSAAAAASETVCMLEKDRRMSSLTFLPHTRNLLQTILKTTEQKYRKYQKLKV